MSGDESPAETVAGERAAALVHRARGLQSRLGSVLALGLMVSIGAGALSWYYAHLWHVRAATASHRAAGAATQPDLPLPSLGRIDPPAAPAAPTAVPAAAPPPPTAAVAPNPEMEAPLPVAASSLYPPATRGDSGVDAPKSRAERALERRLGGAAFVATSGGSAATPAGAAGAGLAEPPPQASQAARGLGALLQPTLTTPVRARLLPTTRLLLPKGAFIDCTLETAIDSSLPGFTTCITATDTFGADGEVVLLERGTKLVGEVRGEVRQGIARVFVLWTEARTPEGVEVPLDSPATDELGRAGLPGRVNRHFWQRFGAAMLVSVIDAGVQAGVQASNRGGGTVVVNPTAGEGVLTEVLRNTIAIAPTVIKHQGDRIQVLVARDLDFRSVYALRIDAARGRR